MKVPVTGGAGYIGSVVTADLIAVGNHVVREHHVSGVVHFTASIEVGESMKVPEKDFRNNTANTLALIQTMLECGVTKMVLSSTAALYGNPKRTPIREDDPLEAGIMFPKISRKFFVKTS